jgi:hypothetical protein
MKHLIFIVLCTLILSGCSGWTIQPLPYISPSPFPSSTPIILSATPIFLPPPVTLTSSTLSSALTTSATTSTPTLEAITATLSDTPTTTAAPMTLTPSATSTPFSAVNTIILGCSTSIDITHGMGEVTNAYITIQNIGTMDISNVCATLNALDEGRAHPDKTKCVDLLPTGYQVSEKLTVDTTFKQSTSIQVDVNTSGNLLQRVAQNSCTDLGLFPPNLGVLGTVTPIPTP